MCAFITERPHFSPLVVFSVREVELEHESSPKHVVYCSGKGLEALQLACPSLDLCI